MTNHAFDALRTRARAIQALDTYSSSDKTDSGFADVSAAAEKAAYATLLKCADDFHRIEKATGFSDEISIDPDFDEVRFAAISMMRNDIQVSKDELSTRFVLKTVRANDFAHTSQLDVSDAQLNEWVDERIELIRKAIEKGANFVTLGEFDFPQSEEHAIAFDRAIKSLINSTRFKDQPIFLIAGSRHEPEPAANPTSCHNNAKVYLNEKMAKMCRVQDLEFPIDHNKVLSAEKAGERISPAPLGRIPFYNTPFGRTGILICVDAYSPSVIFALLNDLDQTRRSKFRYIIVPAYNFSQRLYFACQTLSYLCQNVVVLADASSISANKRQRVEMFICGRSFEDIRKKDSSLQRKVQFQSVAEKGAHESTVWTVALDYLTGVQLERSHVTPFTGSIEDFKFPPEGFKPPSNGDPR